MQNFLTKLYCKASAFMFHRIDTNKLFVGSTAAAIFAAIPTAAYANAGQAIESQITKGAGSLWKILTVIVLPTAALFFAWNAFQALFGGERGMESAKKHMLTIVIVIALVLLAPLVVNEIGGWFKPSSNWTFGN